MVWSPDSLIEVWQTGHRLSYHPEAARDELSQFPQRYAAAQISVQQILESITASSDDKFAKQMSRNGDEAPVPKRAEEHKTFLERVLAQLKDGKP